MAMEMREILGKNLTELRENKGISRQSAANFLSISRASLEYYEKGKRLPDAETLAKLADYYDVSTDYLLGRSSVPSEKSEFNSLITAMGMSVEDIAWLLDGIDEMIDEESDDFAQILINLFHRATNEHVYFYWIIKNIAELKKDTKLISDSRLFSLNLKQELSVLFTKQEMAKYEDKIKLLYDINDNYNEIYKRLKYEIIKYTDGIVDCNDSLHMYTKNSREEWQKILDLSTEEIEALYRLFQEG